MDSSHHHHYSSSSSSVFRNLLYLFLLVSSNLVTFYFSSQSPPSMTTTAFLPSPSSTVDVSSSSPLPELPPEFLAFTSPKHLPFGYNANMDSDEIHPATGLACPLFSGDLKRYMSYNLNGSCPDDELLAQKLLLRGCEPLPRRRCRPAAPDDAVHPLPVPESLWSIPPDRNVHWSAYTCKDFQCLVDRKRNSKAFDDCKDCFDLAGREKSRWVTPSNNPLDFTIDEVLASRPPGTIRIGLDIGGGSGTFAVRMLERNVTVVATSMNLNGPFNSFIATRGIVPMYISISQRLPFFDNTLDIIHSMHVLSNWIPTTLMHFIFFDIYRVLRPGGVFWLDHFFFVEEQMTEYLPVIDSVGFNKIRWEIGRKLDRGPELKEMYISALLEKPLKNSWK